MRVNLLAFRGFACAHYCYKLSFVPVLQIAGRREVGGKPFELGIDEEEGKLATETRLRRPFGIAFDPDGNLYVMDTLNSRIVKVAL